MIKMYSEKQKHKIKKCYINLSSNSFNDSQKIIDLINLFDYNTIFIFNRNILYNKDLNDILYTLGYYSDYYIKYYDYDFKILDVLDVNYINNLDVKVDGDFFNKVKSRNDIKYYNYYVDLKTFNYNVFNLKCDIFVDSGNINHIHSTVRMMSDMGIYSNIYFKDHKKSSFYNDYFCNSIYCCYKNIFNMLTIDNIVNDNKLLINNRDCILNNYKYNDEQCYCYNDIEVLCINEKYNIDLCPSIKIDTELNSFEHINHGTLSNFCVDKIHELYSMYCLGCNYKQL